MFAKKFTQAVAKNLGPIAANGSNSTFLAKNFCTNYSKHNLWTQVVNQDLIKYRESQLLAVDLKCDIMSHFGRIFNTHEYSEVPIKKEENAKLKAQKNILAGLIEGILPKNFWNSKDPIGDYQTHIGRVWGTSPGLPQNCLLDEVASPWLTKEFVEKFAKVIEALESELFEELIQKFKEGRQDLKPLKESYDKLKEVSEALQEADRKQENKAGISL